VLNCISKSLGVVIVKLGIVIMKLPIVIVKLDLHSWGESRKESVEFIIEGIEVIQIQRAEPLIYNLVICKVNLVNKYIIFINDGCDD